MSWSKVGQVVGKSLPILGTVLGGPAGAAVGGLAAKALGVKDEPDAVLTALQADPEALLKLRELEAAHSAEFERLYVADLANARSRDIEIHKLRQKNSRADVLAVVAILGLLLAIGALFFFEPPATAESALLILIGTLGTVVTQVYAFEFGSSRGSKEKDRPNGGGGAH